MELQAETPRTTGQGGHEPRVPTSSIGRRIVAISGSPSPESKTASLAEHALALIASEGVECTHIRLAALGATALLSADANDPMLAKAIASVEDADGVIIATPIFKAAYSGLLKVFIDALPQFGLAGKVVLPLATGGSPAHVLAIDYGLRPVLQSMGARHVVQGVFVGSSQMTTEGGRLLLAPESESLLREAILHFTFALSGDGAPALLGHPRPSR